MLDAGLKQKLSDGAKMYLCPVGVVSGGGFGLSVLGTGLRFAAIRVMARTTGKRFFDRTISVDHFDDFRAELGKEAQRQVDTQLSNLTSSRVPLVLPTGQQLPFTKNIIAGVVNVTPDSFSDGGRFMAADQAIAQGQKLFSEGADIIDVGGESTRPGAEPVWEGDEKDRVLPVIEALSREGIPVSIDTRHSTVMEAALKAGASLINDVSALTYDSHSMNIAVANRVPIVLMHAKGSPKTMQDNPVYDDVLLDIYDYLQERIYSCLNMGIELRRLIVDPGIGFGKRVVEDNLAIVRGLPLFHTFGCPLLVGPSRKRFVGAVTGVDRPADRVQGSVAAALELAGYGVQIVRVHDVKETVEALRFKQACHDSAVMDFLQPSD